MKRCIIILVAILLLLVGCQSRTESDKREPSFSAEQETIHALPPKSISLYSLNELNQLKMIMKTKDENNMQKMIRQHGLTSSDDIVNFLEVIESMPVLKLFDGEITYIGYRWPISVDNVNAGDLSTANQNLGIAYITIQAKDGSWFRVNYWLKNKNMSMEDILESSDRSTSLLKTPIQVVNDRCIVYHETRTPHLTDSGDVITWLAVVDGIPVMIKYYSENAKSIKAETALKDATIGLIQ